MKRIGIWVAVMVLLGALALQLAPVRDVKEGDRAGGAQPIGLAERMPRALPGWAGRDEPLGPNEVVATAVERVLNFDDNVYRTFRRGDTTLGVYVAYWAPGRMPIQKVASHTPDRCWTENGWRCLDRRHHVAVREGSVEIGGAQGRIFEPPGQPGHREHVLYWHVVGDRLYDYGERFNARPHPLDWWRDTVAYALSGSDAQYFIRVTSNRDFAELAGDPGWAQVVAALKELGLGQVAVGTGRPAGG
jgi:hypothetical protein